MGLKGGNLSEAVNLRCHEGQFWGSEQTAFMGGWDVEPTQKKNLVRILKGDMCLSVRANNTFLRINMIF